MRHLNKLTLLILVLSCSACNQVQQPKGDKEALTTPVSEAPTLEGLWELTKLNDTIFDINEIYDFNESQPRLVFDLENGEINGYSGCNNSEGFARFLDNAIVISGPLTTTRRNCGDTGWEVEFYNRVMDMQRYSIEDQFCI